MQRENFPTRYDSACENERQKQGGMCVGWGMVGEGSEEVGGGEKGKIKLIKQLRKLGHLSSHPRSMGPKLVAHRPTDPELIPGR